MSDQQRIITFEIEKTTFGNDDQVEKLRVRIEKTLRTTLHDPEITVSVTEVEYPVDGASGAADTLALARDAKMQRDHDMGAHDGVGAAEPECPACPRRRQSLHPTFRKNGY